MTKTIKVGWKYAHKTLTQRLLVCDLGFQEDGRETIDKIENGWRRKWMTWLGDQMGG